METTFSTTESQTFICKGLKEEIFYSGLAQKKFITLMYITIHFAEL